MVRLLTRALALLALHWLTLAAAAEATAPCSLATRSERIGQGTIVYNSVGSGPQVLLIHGLFANKEQWNALACLLAESGFTAIAVDLPGYGKSEGFALPDYSLESQVAKLRALTTRLDIQRIDLAGNSMGGAIVALYASRYPRQVRSVAFIGAPLGVIGWNQGIRDAIRKGINPFVPVTEPQLDVEVHLLPRAGHLLHMENAAEVAPLYADFLKRTGAGRESPGPKSVAATFDCQDGKTVKAVFENGAQSLVKLALSDGRELTLPQAPSGSGARYADANESFVFWNKGDTAFIEESGTTTYRGCNLRR